MPEDLNLGRLALPPPDLTALLCPITGFPAGSEMLMGNLVVASAIWGAHVCSYLSFLKAARGEGRMGTAREGHSVQEGARGPASPKVYL